MTTYGLDYGLRWTVWTGKRGGGRPTPREKFFRTAEARDAFADALAENDRFHGFTAWVDPPAEEGGEPCDA